jgi:hypothetical protein
LIVLLQTQVDQKVKYSDYFKLCREQGVRKAVAINDLKDVVAYLTGSISHSDMIDVALLLEQKGAMAPEKAMDDSVARPVSGTADSKPDFRSEEVLLSTRDSVLQNPRKEFTLVLQIIEQVWKEDAKNEKSQSTPSKRRRAAEQGFLFSLRFDFLSDLFLVDKSVKKGAPIIIVPTSLASVVTIYNAKEFFEEGRWVASSEKRASVKVMPDVVSLTRKSGITGNQVKYEIYHDAGGFTSEMWRRVVCVVVQGQAWQFKDWKIGTPQEIFERFYCCYLHFDDEKPRANIATWGVKSFSVSKTRCHLTTSVYHTLWNNIEQRIVAHKSNAIHL